MYAYDTTDLLEVTVAATPEPIEIEVGKTPKKIEIINKSTGAYAVWDSTMPDDAILVVSDGGGGGGTGVKVADGITVSQGYIDETTGITVNEDAEGNPDTTKVILGTLDDFNDTASEVLSIFMAF